MTLTFLASNDIVGPDDDVSISAVEASIVDSCNGVCSNFKRDKRLRCDDAARSMAQLVSIKQLDVAEIES